MQNFSVYQWVEQARNSPIRIEEPRRLARLCRHIENEVISQQLNAAVFAGFQSFSRLLPVLGRYQVMANTAQAVFVFGVPDAQITLPIELRTVAVTPDSLLSYEWFLIVNHMHYTKAVIGREVVKPGTTQRAFSAIMTQDRGFIRDLTTRIYLML